jgi:hypothetical protein
MTATGRSLITGRQPAVKLQRVNNTSDQVPLEPLPPTVRRSLQVAAFIGAAAAFSIIFVVGSGAALMFGWHPLPETAVGCYLHKTFHAFNARVESQKLIANADCIKVSTLRRDGMIRDATRIKALHSWLATRVELWQENLLSLIDKPGPPVLIIRPCSQRHDYDEYIYANEDWLGVVPGKALMRPICRNQWREVAALVWFTGTLSDR